MRTHLFCLLLAAGLATAKPARPYNILYIMTDDHAAHAVGSYGGRLAELDPTPTLDKLAGEGIRFSNCFVTNSICTPSRASMLTGQYSQTNGVLDLGIPLPPAKQFLPKEMSKLGYQTAIIGKWHLHETPAAFDFYKVMYEHGGQGSYFDPKFITTGTPYPEKRNDVPARIDARKGHSSDVITDITIDWLDNGRDKSKPFFLMHHYKAPHDMFESAPRYGNLWADVKIPEPESLYDRGKFGSIATKGVDDAQIHAIGTSISKRHSKRSYVDLLLEDKGEEVPADPRAATSAAYQKYLKAYLRCVRGVDDNLKRLFDHLKAAGLWDNTIIIYSSDQGMMLGEHDYQDKRWFYEESIHMPFIARHPAMKKTGATTDMVINNVDFAPTILGLAGQETPDYMQGRDFSNSILTAAEPADWDNTTYYRYWMHMIHHDIPAHFGIRTKDYKLMFFVGRHYDEEAMGRKSMVWLKDSNLIEQTPPAWEFYDLSRDPQEQVNRHNDPEYKAVIQKLKKQLKQKREELNETEEKFPKLQEIIEQHWN